MDGCWAFRPRKMTGEYDWMEIPAQLCRLSGCMDYSKQYIVAQMMTPMGQMNKDGLSLFLSLRFGLAAAVPAVVGYCVLSRPQTSSSRSVEQRTEVT